MADPVPRRRFLAATATLPVVGPSSAAPPAGLAAADVDDLAAAALRRWAAPGLAVAVVRGGRVAVLKGYGVRRLGAADPVTPDTQFPLASCTKGFTSALLATLVDDGKLGWDDPVRRHLPTFRLADPHADALLTVRDLVTHRTGLAGHDLLWYRAPWELEETLRRSARLPLSAPFRGGYEYNSTLFVAAGKAAANRADRPWDQLLRDRLTGPLGMAGAAFTSAEAAGAVDRASPHRIGADGRVGPCPRYDDREPNPAGSLSATARDLTAWLTFQLAGGVWGGKRLVSADNLAETKTPHTVMRLDAELRQTYPDSAQASYAMGWVVFDRRGHLVVAHGGMIDGFRAQLTLVPGIDAGIAVLCNLHGSKLTTAVTNGILDRLLGLPPTDWVEHFLGVEKAEREAKRAALAARDAARRPGTTPSLPPAGYAGRYEHPAYGEATVSVDGDRLVWAWSSFRCPLEHYHGDTFRVADGFLADELVAFAVDGRTTTGANAMGLAFGRK